MTTNVTIMRGLPGSGKSYEAEALAKRLTDNGEPVLVCSADSYFMKDGSYQFDPRLLAQAHAQCLRNYVEGLVAKAFNHIIVDNTNVHVWEIAPYMAVGHAYADDVVIATIECSTDIAIRRNTHSVPESTIIRMAAELDAETKLFPPWWKHMHAKAGGL